MKMRLEANKLSLNVDKTNFIILRHFKVLHLKLSVSKLESSLSKKTLLSERC